MENLNNLKNNEVVAKFKTPVKNTIYVKDEFKKNLSNQHVSSSDKERDDISKNRMYLITGIYTGVSLIIYFSMMSLLNIHKILFLHYLNIIFLFFGVRYAIKKSVLFFGEIRYLEGLKAGFIVTGISILVFNAFLLFYTALLDPSFLTYLQKEIFIGMAKSKAASIFGLLGITTAEGLSSGFILTYILMQYYKGESSETM